LNSQLRIERQIVLANSPISAVSGPKISYYRKGNLPAWIGFGRELVIRRRDVKRSWMMCKGRY